MTMTSVRAGSHVGRPIEQLVSEISTLHSQFDATAAESEELGDAPPALVDLMRQIRVPMIKAPLEAGGDRLLLADQCRYFTALSYSNATAAWTGFNHAGAAAAAGSRLSDEGVELLFGTDSSPFLAAVALPTGTFTRVDGGVLVNGTWNYASGVRHADWAMLTAIEASDQPSVTLAVIRTADATVHGDWNVMALKGTGSVSITAKDVFVPTALTVDPMEPPKRGGAIYGLNYTVFVAGENLGFTFGTCQRFIDELVVYARSKSRGFDGRLADRGAFQYELGRSAQQLKAVQAHALATLAEVDEVMENGGEFNARHEAGVAAMTAYCTETAVAAISRLMSFAGAGALFNTSPLQRCFRDAQGSAQHLVASNQSLDKFGAVLLTDA
ncbi:MAG: acyl-CoA dehydrogenase family protein [Actinobacteria bacterium]|nr:acyl-CoA dehydrogenase family protein [Actinomycetota bacterium]